MKIEVGDKVRITAEFDLDDVLTDPDTVTAKIVKSNSVEVVPSPTRDSEGVYYIDVDIDVAGRWYAKFLGAGTVFKGLGYTFYVVANRAD